MSSGGPFKHELWCDVMIQWSLAAALNQSLTVLLQGFAACSAGE